MTDENELNTAIKELSRRLLLLEAYVIELTKSVIALEEKDKEE